MKELLFATENISKVNRFSAKLLENGIKLKSLKDFDFDIKIDENGKTAIENATQKATTCYEATGLTTMAIDDTMYIEDIPEDKQPGVYVRRVNGKRLNDKEMINYYTNLVKQYGKNGRLNTKWISGIVIVKDGKIYTHEEITSEYYLVDKPTPEIKDGYPLSSIMIYKKLNKYDIYLTEEDKKVGRADDSNIINFISDTLNK